MNFSSLDSLLQWAHAISSSCKRRYEFQVTLYFPPLNSRHFIKFQVEVGMRRGAHCPFSSFENALAGTTLNRDIKGTEKLKGPFKQNCTYLEHDVQPLHTSITIDVHPMKIFM